MSLKLTNQTGKVEQRENKYEMQRGASITLKNSGSSTVEVTQYYYDGSGQVQNRSTFPIEPGKTRGFNPAGASISIVEVSSGSASSGSPLDDLSTEMQVGVVVAILAGAYFVFGGD
jgi:hypothetical protein